MQPIRLLRALESTEVDAIANHDNLRRVVALLDQPVLDGVGVYQDGVREPADEALDARLHRREIWSAVADRRDDDRRRRQPRRRDREHVAVEVVRVHDVNPPIGDVAGEAALLRERLDAPERGDVVFEKRNAALIDFAHEAAPPAQARELEIEAARVERTPERHELILGAAAHERGHDVE